jgi:hypothetical protein
MHPILLLISNIMRLILISSNQILIQRNLSKRSLHTQECTQSFLSMLFTVFILIQKIFHRVIQLLIFKMTYFVIDILILF